MTKCQLLFFCLLLSTVHAQKNMEMMMAEMSGRAMAMRNLLAMTHGEFLTYTLEKGIKTKIKQILGYPDNETIEAAFESMIGNVKNESLQQWPEKLLVKVQASVVRTELVKYYQGQLQKKVKRNKLSQENADEMLVLLENLFEEKEYSAVAYGFSNKKKDPSIEKFMGSIAGKRIRAEKEVLYLYQKEAASISSRLEAFFVLGETPTARTYGMRVFGIQVHFPEPEFSLTDLCLVGATWTRKAFIASLELSLREANQPKLSEEELTALKNLPETQNAIIQD